jgi:hypothetical protein
MRGIVWGSACRVGTVGMVSDMGNYLHVALWVVAQVDHVAGVHFDVQRDSRSGFRLDACQAEHKGAGVVADVLECAVKQCDLGGARPRRCHRKRPYNSLPHMLAMCGRLNSRDRYSRLRPAERAASAMVLTSPATMASMAVPTLLEMRLGLSGAAGS